jgi:hypothetical protein
MCEDRKHVGQETFNYTGNNRGYQNCNKGLKKILAFIPRKHSVDPLQKTTIFGASHMKLKVLQSEF